MSSSSTAPSTPAFPADWPAAGPIDLSVQDLPHDSSRVEWWYVNTHVTADDGSDYSLFAAFFRVDTSDRGKDTDHRYSHFLTWALTDVHGRRYFPETRLDAESPAMAVQELDAGLGPRDKRLADALREVVAAGAIPLPDRLIEGRVHVAPDRLALDFGGNRFTKLDDGSYELSLSSQGGHTGCTLRFVLQKDVVRHGDEGVVRGLKGEAMFYYFSPRCCVTGTVVVDGAAKPVEGNGWYDHEFGDNAKAGHGHQATVGWNWLAAQLDNGCEISAYDLFDRDDPSISHGRWVIVIDAAGERRAYDEFSFVADEPWTSTRTFNDYPTHFTLNVPGAGILLDIAATIPDQELVTVLSPPGFWEGRVELLGMMRGRAVAGVGFIERSGASTVDTTDDFFSAVGRETRRAIDVLLPEKPNAEQAEALIGGAGRRDLLNGVDLDQYSRTVLQPIRDIILRGGKAWRSYGLLSCIDVVGGNSQRYADWLAMPELLHVGSLIIDDVQDDSDVRRGGPACHKVYGDALAINAGCASYFLAQLPIGTSHLDLADRVAIYESYFEAVRAAHAGQAFDIDTVSASVPLAIESGDGAALERRVLAVHRLKSAVPPGALARMSARLGGGSPEQAHALGRLFEAFGLAFQVIDDVLNLRGFDENRKVRGEDITAGKVTAPVAKAMSRLDLDGRRRLWDLLQQHSTDPKVIRTAIDLIDGCGALAACEQDARAMVEDAWQAARPLLPDSQFTVRLRAFGWFVLDRHY